MEEGLVSTSRRRTRTRTREERMETFRETNPGKPSPIGRVMLTLRGIPHAGKRNGGTLFGRLILRPSLLGCPAGVVMRNAGSIGIPPQILSKLPRTLGTPDPLPGWPSVGIFSVGKVPKLPLRERSSGYLFDRIPITE